MIIMGINAGVVGKAAGLTVHQIGTYRYNDHEAVYAYDTPHAVEFINIPASVYGNYNAWIQIPGEWRGYYSEVLDISIQGKTLHVPMPVGKNKAALTGKYYQDLFSFICKEFTCKELDMGIARRAFDLCYTIGRMNSDYRSFTDYHFKRFLDMYVTKW